MTFYVPNSAETPFLSTTNYLPEDQPQRTIRTQEILNLFAKAINYREIGIYEQIEIITGQLWFTTGNAQVKRNTFRKVFSFGTINAGAALNIAHGITSLTAFTYMAGSIITATPDFRPLPYVDVVNVTNQVSVLVTGPNITISNGATAPIITSGILILEYLKN